MVARLPTTPDLSPSGRDLPHFAPVLARR